MKIQTTGQICDFPDLTDNGSISAIDSYVHPYFNNPVVNNLDWLSNPFILEDNIVELPTYPEEAAVIEYVEGVDKLHRVGTPPDDTYCFIKPDCSTDETFDSRVGKPTWTKVATEKPFKSSTTVCIVDSKPENTPIALSEPEEFTEIPPVLLMLTPKSRPVNLSLPVMGFDADVVMLPKSATVYTQASVNPATGKSETVSVMPDPGRGFLCPVEYQHSESVVSYVQCCYYSANINYTVKQPFGGRC